MSKLVKSDKLKTNKTESQVVRLDVALNKYVTVKSQAKTRPSKIVTQLNANVPSTDEEEAKSKKQINKLAYQATTSGNSQRNKAASQQVGKSSSQRKQTPICANQVATSLKNKTATKKNIRILDKTFVYKKQNAVLDTPQNVTICSPPPKRKNDYGHVVTNDDNRIDNSKIIRKCSRTLAPDEIVILKSDSAKMRFEEKVVKRSSDIETAIDVREPVSFEVKFEDKSIKDRSIVRERFNTIDRAKRNEEEPNYSDDFESYESDFESDFSENSVEKLDSAISKIKNVSELSKEKSEYSESTEEENQDISFNQLSSDDADGREQEDDSEITKSLITEILRDKERKLDSGHYDMNSRKISSIKAPYTAVQFIDPIKDSLENGSLGISEQMDSGISTCAASTHPSYNNSTLEIVYAGNKDFFAKPNISARGSELLTKIQFDILSFTLLDLKPISYDIFMRTFGKINTNQNFTQTEDNQMNAEQQTESQTTRSIWTQHPALFQLDISNNLDMNQKFHQYCFGEIIDECAQQQFPIHCELEQSLHAIKQLSSDQHTKREFYYQKRQSRPINYENLSSFLLRSSLVIDQILGSSSTNNKSKQIKNNVYENDAALRRISEKSFYVETNFLNTLRVIKLFSNNKYNLLITVHESLPDKNVYSSDFTNLLMVWSMNNCDKPLRLLTTWSQVSKIEISNDSSDIVVAALSDGSVALWDLRETYSFCSKLDGYLTHFAATQSIIPYRFEEGNNTNLTMDLGACLNIKSFKSQTDSILIQTIFPTIQFATLHDSGFITVWTLVETSDTSINLGKADKYEKLKCFTHAFEYTSPWARVKLIQSTLINIREHLENKSHHLQSRFDKTKAFFQKNVYSDEALKELHEYTSEIGQQGIRFTSLECGSENIFVCTNRNFILMCSKTLKMDKLRRIVINESQFLFPTALKLLNNDNFLAVGLSNGVVMIVNCQPHKLNHTQKIIKKNTLSKLVNADVRDSGSNNTTISGKSCIVQNILLNVEKSCQDIDFDREYRPSTAACITLIDSKKKPYELRILDQQIIMNGSVLRKNLIQSLEISSDGWHLFALANGHVRMYDFYLDQEIPYDQSQETGSIIGIATGQCGKRENNLMILRPNSEVEIYILNK